MNRGASQSPASAGGRRSHWDSALALRLFADRDEPTLTVPEQIAARIGDRILAGTVAPGEHVFEQELATEFRVSRGPVREAIRILEREGLVTVLARRGAMVTELNAQEVREIFEVRIALWELAGRKFVANPDPQVIATMRANLAEMEWLAELDDDDGRYAETAYQFWVLFAREIANRRLSRMLSSLSLQTLRYSKLGMASRERRKRSLEGWREVLRALSQGDADRFVELTSGLMRDSCDEAARRLGESGEKPA
ncbi:MAG: GntR family transcriptional regulator [Burkholderiaceae bacterium]|nr:GntR family transcriptional regulator [Burkholderiaceae bacterium]